MKRTPLKRGTKRLQVRKVLQRGGNLARGKRLRREGVRSKRERKARDLMRKAVLERAGGRCERCGRNGRRLHVHHRMGRGRGAGAPNLHSASNGVALCSHVDNGCHELVERRRCADWADWIDSAKGVPVSKGNRP